MSPSADRRRSNRGGRTSATKPAVVGHVEATAHVTGPLSEPTISFETNGRSIAWSDVQVSTIRATGGYGAGQLSLNTFTLGIAGGTVDGHGTIAVDDTRRQSRIEARWSDIDAQSDSRAARLAGTLSKSGTAIVEWRTRRAVGIAAVRRPRDHRRRRVRQRRPRSTCGDRVKADRWHVEDGPSGHQRAGPQRRRRHPPRLTTDGKRRRSAAGS